MDSHYGIVLLASELQFGQVIITLIIAKNGLDWVGMVIKFGGA